MSSELQRSFQSTEPSSRYGSVEEARRNIARRRKSGIVWQIIFYFATTVSVAALAVLLLTIINSAFGYVAIKNTIEPETLAGGTPLDDLSSEELIAILEENISSGLLRRFNYEEPLSERSIIELVILVEARVVEPKIVESWDLFPSLFARNEVIEFVNEKAEPGTRIEFRAWLNPRFIVSPQNPDPQFAGVRTAIFGSLWMLVIVVAVAFPLGVGSAIYLEEYAHDTPINRLIQVNIYNLSGVPSIIYGLLGLAVFVRVLGPVTSGEIFGDTATLIMTGAATVIFVDPTGIFSQFTALPIQIYQWSARPQGAFRNVAAAAIIILLVLLLSMNAYAIITRDRIRRRRLM